LDFQLTQDQEAIRDMVRDFARNEIEPNAPVWDEEQHFPRELFSKLGELGLLGIVIPEEYGGAGLGYVEYAAILEEIGAADGGIGLSVAAHNSLCTNHLYLFGSEELKREFLPKLAAGEWIGAWGLTESEAGSDAGGTRTTAVRDGGEWVLNGSKTFITHATVGDAALLVARTSPEGGHHGISAFFVPFDRPGIVPGKKENKLGMRASDTSSLILEDCRIPSDYLLGGEGDGFVQAMKVLDGGRISIAALSVGIARGALDATLAYARTREQFGKTLAAQPVIQNMIADMGTDLEAARMMGYQACWLKDEGRPFTKEAAMAKVMATEAAGRAADTAVQIHGGYGYCKEYAVERYYRDVRVTRIYEGTSEIQRLVIARKLLAEY
jgi:alkylation response protein AidB-like acyl-CoA dehydrogenase